MDIFFFFIIKCKHSETPMALKYRNKNMPSELVSGL